MFSAVYFSWDIKPDIVALFRIWIEKNVFFKFLYFLVLSTKGQKEASFGLEHRKIAVIDYRNINCSFPKELIHGFGQNLESTSFFGFKQNRPKRSKPSLKKSKKNIDFRKGLISPWFLEICGNLLIFCFKQNRPKKIVLSPSTLKTSLFRLQKQFCIFPKGLVHGFGEK